MKLISLALCVALSATGCATATGSLQASQTPEPADHSRMAAYARQLPVGARVRADLSDGRRVHGTLMTASDEAVVLQRHTRLPEPPLEIPLDSVQRLELDSPSNLGKAIAIGVASGVCGVLAVFAILAAIYSD